MYRLSLLLFVLVTLLARLCFLDEYPIGFSSHTVIHAKLRARLYQSIYLSPWTTDGWRNLSDVLIRDQHGPQSFLEALLVPLFGFGSAESRLMISVLGIVSVCFVVLWGSVGVSKWFGLLLGLTVGLAPYGLYFSRYGDSEHINIYLQAFLLLYACQRVITYGSVRDYVLMGLASGLSLYVYATNQILLLITIPLALFLKFLQWRSDRRGRWPLSVFKLFLFCVISVGVVYPLLSHYFQMGRIIPARSPLANPEQVGLSLSVLPQRFAAAWREFFVSGGDTWFYRDGGSIKDWDLVLVLPGLITMLALIRSVTVTVRETKDDPRDTMAAATYARSVYFFCAVTILIVALGPLPGALSPEPSFRRIVLTAIGVDIIEAFGLYGVVRLALKVLPQIIARIAVFATLATFTLIQWNAFFYDSRSQESLSNNVVVSLVREMKRKVRSGEETFVLMPEKSDLSKREERLMWIEYEFGFTERLPTNLKLLEIAELGALARRDVIVSIEDAREIQSGKLRLPPGVKATKVRIFSNRGGETHALVDFEVEARAVSAM